MVNTIEKVQGVGLAKVQTVMSADVPGNPGPNPRNLRATYIRESNRGRQAAELGAYVEFNQRGEMAFESGCPPPRDITGDQISPLSEIDRSRGRCRR